MYFSHCCYFWLREYTDNVIDMQVIVIIFWIRVLIRVVIVIFGPIQANTFLLQLEYYFNARSSLCDRVSTQSRRCFHPNRACSNIPSLIEYTKSKIEVFLQRLWAFELKCVPTKHKHIHYILYKSRNKRESIEGCIAYN